MKSKLDEIRKLLDDIESTVTIEKGDNNLQTRAFIYPIINPIVSSGYGMRFHPVKKIMKPHNGIDFGIKCGEPIFASQDGEVIFSGVAGDYGNTVILQHANNMRTYYCHCSRIFVKVGRFVEQSDVLALVGTTGCSTGCHLHFGMKVENTYVNPLDFVS